MKHIKSFNITESALGDNWNRRNFYNENTLDFQEFVYDYFKKKFNVENLLMRFEIPTTVNRIRMYFHIVSSSKKEVAKVKQYLEDNEDEVTKYFEEELSIENVNLRVVDAMGTTDVLWLSFKVPESYRRAKKSGLLGLTTESVNSKELYSIIKDVITGTMERMREAIEVDNPYTSDMMLYFDYWHSGDMWDNIDDIHTNYYSVFDKGVRDCKGEIMNSITDILQDKVRDYLLEHPEEYSKWWEQYTDAGSKYLYYQKLLDKVPDWIKRGGRAGLMSFKEFESKNEMHIVNINVYDKNDLVLFDFTNEQNFVGKVGIINKVNLDRDDGLEIPRSYYVNYYIEGRVFGKTVDYEDIKYYINPTDENNIIEFASKYTKNIDELFQFLTPEQQEKYQHLKRGNKSGLMSFKEFESNELKTEKTKWTDKWKGVEGYLKPGYMYSYAHMVAGVDVPVCFIGNKGGSRPLLFLILKKIAPAISNFGEKFSFQFIELVRWAGNPEQLPSLNISLIDYIIDNDIVFDTLEAFNNPSFKSVKESEESQQLIKQMEDELLNNPDIKTYKRSTTAGLLGLKTENWDPTGWKISTRSTGLRTPVYLSTVYNDWIDNKYVGDRNLQDYHFSKEQVNEFIKLFEDDIKKNVEDLLSFFTVDDVINETKETLDELDEKLYGDASIIRNKICSTYEKSKKFRDYAYNIGALSGLMKKGLSSLLRDVVSYELMSYVRNVLLEVIEERPDIYAIYHKEYEFNNYINPNEVDDYLKRGSKGGLWGLKQEGLTDWFKKTEWDEAYEKAKRYIASMYWPEGEEKKVKNYNRSLYKFLKNKTKEDIKKQFDKNWQRVIDKLLIDKSLISQAKCLIEVNKEFVLFTMNIIHKGPFFDNIAENWQIYFIYFDNILSDFYSDIFNQLIKKEPAVIDLIINKKPGEMFSRYKQRILDEHKEELRSSRGGLWGLTTEQIVTFNPHEYTKDELLSRVKGYIDYHMLEEYEDWEEIDKYLENYQHTDLWNIYPILFFLNISDDYYESLTSNMEDDEIAVFLQVAEEVDEELIKFVLDIIKEKDENDTEFWSSLKEAIDELDLSGRGYDKIVALFPQWLIRGKKADLWSMKTNDK